MKISVIHATRRGDTAFSVINSWLWNASMKPPVEYILSVDESDPYNYDFSDCLEYEYLKVVRNDNRSAVDAFNRGAEAATGDIFICISDDMLSFKDWDLFLLKDIACRTDFYMKVRDGLQPTLVTLPVFDRIYYNRLGYVWNPDFRHMFVDQEATAVAIMTGRYIKSELLFPHAHYTTGQIPKDALNLRNDSTWHQGETLFNERLKTNFGIDNPVVPYSSIQWR